MNVSFLGFYFHWLDCEHIFHEKNNFYFKQFELQGFTYCEMIHAPITTINPQILKYKLYYVIIHDIAHILDVLYTHVQMLT